MIAFIYFSFQITLTSCPCAALPCRCTSTFFSIIVHIVSSSFSLTIFYLCFLRFLCLFFPFFSFFFFLSLSFLSPGSQLRSLLIFLVSFLISVPSLSFGVCVFFFSLSLSVLVHSGAFLSCFFHLTSVCPVRNGLLARLLQLRARRVAAPAHPTAPTLPAHAPSSKRKGKESIREP